MASSIACATSFEQEMLQLIRAKGGTIAGTQQYPYPSHVNPFGIVSIKLAGKSTYNLWQEQILCLIESHGMQGFINGRCKNPQDNGDSQNTEGKTTEYEEWKRSDSLVKGWIFSSLSKKVMSSVVGLPTAMDVWRKLKITYGPLKGTQQYPYPSHVQPNKFVSMKLSGQKNYWRWQEKMARLIERHGMQGFIDGRFKNPKENGDSQTAQDDTTKYVEWKKSDSLVKGWIFGSLSEDVMGSVVDLSTAMDVWNKLNTTYSALTTDNTGTQHYPYPCHVRPSDFVSIMLSGENNYNRWQEQLSCLIETHGMEGFIDGTFKNPNENDDSQNIEAETTEYKEWKRSDSLVKGWIFGSLSENVMSTVVDIPKAMDVWKKLNTSYGSVTTTSNKETQEYPYPSHVDPIHFVSIKLSGKENFSEWWDQMVCLIESHDMMGFLNGKLETPEKNYESDDMEGKTTQYEDWKRSESLLRRWIVGSLSENIKRNFVGLPKLKDVLMKLAGTIHLTGIGFIDGRFKNPKEKGDSQNTEGETTLYEEWKRSDSLVKGLIFGSLSEHVMDTVVGVPTARGVWKKLNSDYGTHNKGTEQYPRLSNVQPNDFVSIVLSSEKNYNRWQEQMVCLLEGHGMLGFIEDSSEKRADNWEEWERSNTIVKGWIIGSLSENVLREVKYFKYAYRVWGSLISNYRALTTTEDRGLAESIPLHRAIVQGDWETALQHFNQDHNALTVKLNRWGDRPLDIAIESNANIDFLENLLEKIDTESLRTSVNHYGYTPLYTAAICGNLKAAERLVEKDPALLFISNASNLVPLIRAVHSKATFQYLLEASKRHIQLSQPEGYDNPFEYRAILDAALDERMIDVAYDLIKEYPLFAITRPFNEYSPLSSMVKKADLYYSGTQYNFYQRFIYTHVPVDKIVRGDSTDHVQDIENQETVVSRCWRSCFCTDVIQRIYVKFWEITLLYVSHIKHLKEDKAKHKTTLALLKCICEEVGKVYLYSDIEDILYTAINVAVENDTSEAIKEIVMHFPQAYNLTHVYYEYNPIQLAIKNRSEKVYNLLVHDWSSKIYFNKERVDVERNNLLHLAGGLAPIHKLNVVSGAALQMQRELQWFQEVEKWVEQKEREAKNKKQETPLMVFRREHLKLRKEGEEWIKKTADSYTITAALIITIVFAAAITIPGGNNDNGKAVYASEPSFIIFAVSDAISLFTSTTSLLLFLSIQTARFRDEDFLYRLPKRLILGLVMLFLSVTSLMVAFSATLYLTFGQEKAWILIPIAALTCLPITSFVTLQFPLLVELISSTYGRGFFGKTKRFQESKDLN